MSTLITPPPTVSPKTAALFTQPRSHAAPIPHPVVPPRPTNDLPKLVLIGEPGSGWRATFDVFPGHRIMVGRPNHATRNLTSVAYLPSRAVSRMHAIITMEDDGLYLTHTKATNLTWRAVESTWTAMRPGDRARLEHTDTLCFGMAPKSQRSVGKVDSPFMISIALLPRGENPANFQFVRKTIHRPVAIPIKNVTLDSGMQSLMNGLDGLNMSFGQMGGLDLKDESDEMTQPMGKRKRGSAEVEDEDEKSMEDGDRDSPPSSNRARKEPPTGTTTSSLASRPSSISRRPASLKGTPRSSISHPNPSINGSSGNGSAKAASLPTAVAVFGLGSVKTESETNTTVDGAEKSVASLVSNAGGEESTTEIQRLVTDLPRKKRVLAGDEPEVAHRGHLMELPGDMEGMKLE